MFVIGIHEVTAGRRPLCESALLGNGRKWKGDKYKWRSAAKKNANARYLQEEFTNNCLLCEFRNFSVKLRWRPVAKHRQNVGKSSFRKLTMEMPAEVTLRTTLSNFVRVRCEFFVQFRRLVRTKIRPSRGSPPSASFHCYGAPLTTFPRWHFNDGASTITILVHDHDVSHAALGHMYPMQH